MSPNPQLLASALLAAFVLAGACSGQSSDAPPPAAAGGRGAASQGGASQGGASGDSSGMAGADQGGVFGGAGAESLGGVAGLGGENGGLSSTDAEFEVTRYDLRVDVSGLSHQLAIGLDVTTSGDCLTLPSELTPLHMRLDGREAQPFELSQGQLRACFDAIPTGAHELSTASQLTYGTFHRDIGLSRRPALDGEFTYLLSWFGGCTHFGPCDADTGRLVPFGVEIEHAESVTALCAGTLEASPTLTRCELTKPAPTYSAFAWMTGTWQRQSLLKRGNTEVVLYEAPSGGVRRVLEVEGVAQFLDWSREKLGELPYGAELRLVTAPTQWLGFEHPANIVLNERLDLEAESLPYQNGVLHIVLHEIVHQWAGNFVTPESALDYAWKEALAEYLVYVFEDEERPVGEADSSLFYWDALGTPDSFHLRPTDEPAPDVSEFYEGTYGVGPLVLFVQLEDLLGRDAVLSAALEFLREGGAKSVADWQATINAATGRDLNDYFERWVFGDGAPDWPELEATSVALGNGQVSVRIGQTQPGPAFPCAVEVDVKSAQSTQRVRAEFPVGEHEKVVELQVNFAETVTKLEIDPRRRLASRKPATVALVPLHVF